MLPWSTTENSPAVGSRPAAEPVQNPTNAKIAALSDDPHQVDPARADIPQADLAKSVQSELSRVGCFKGAVNGEWNADSQRSLALFNRQAGTKFDTKLASLDALDAIKLRSSRICPVICDHGYRADGDQCSKITCAEGSFLNDDNECEKRRGKKPVASRSTDERPTRSDRPARDRLAPGAEAAVPRQQTTAKGSSGQIYCDRLLCRPVNRGCHLEYHGGSSRAGDGGSVEVCN